jgi:transposase InsO family protein
MPEKGPRHAGWVFIGIYNNETAANARRFLRDLERACPLRKRAATGKQGFDTLCSEPGIDHRLTPPQSPRTNHMVERVNGRIEDVLQSYHFRSGEDLNATMRRYVLLYNQHFPQSALQSRAPLQAMKDWHKLKPELFKKNPYYPTGCDN